ncbi:hypothetical protein CRYUN_Cryun08bG0085900 [Craigia yunnanensis]
MFGSKHSLLVDPSLLLALFFLLLAAVANETKPGCNSSCGDLKVPYPFGIRDGCFLEGFGIICNDSYSPPKPFLGDLEVVNIFLAQNQVSLKNFVAHTGWGFNVTEDANSVVSIDLTDTPFAFSNTANKFTVTGCNSLGLIQLGVGEGSTGCFSICSKSNNKSDPEGNNNEPCSGFGCCQTPIFNGLKSLATTIRNIFNESGLNDVLNETEIPASYQCGYAFVVDITSYVFESSDLDQCSSSKIENSRVVLDWVIGNQTCEEAQKNSATYACKENSNCDEYDPDNGVPGYRCSCKQGYQGNPYLSPGCQVCNMDKRI